MLWDPVKDTFKKIPTPDDLFCAGHTQLPDGKLLVAGGTQRYEKLEGDVDEGRRPDARQQREPGQADRPCRQGTRFTGQGERQDLRVQGHRPRSRARRRTSTPTTGKVLGNAPGEARVYVEAREGGTQVRRPAREDKYRDRRA